MNVISKCAVELPDLKTIPYSTPIRVAWADKRSLTIFKKCEVPLQFGAYSKKIWCNILPMDVAHILLGRPWLYMTKMPPILERIICMRPFILERGLS